MRALLSLADEPGPVKRSGGGEPLGIACCGGQSVGTAHAVAMAADRSLLHLLLFLGKCEHRADVVHHGRNGHLGADGTHALMLWAALLVTARSVDRVATRAVLEIGQHHALADGAEPARHILELLAETVSVHQQKDGRRRSVALGMADERLHLAGLGRDVQGLFDHGNVSSPNNRTVEGPDGSLVVMSADRTGRSQG